MIKNTERYYIASLENTRHKGGYAVCDSTKEWGDFEALFGAQVEDARRLAQALADKLNSATSAPK